MIELERLARLEQKVDGISQDISEIKDALKHLDEKFASKYVEKLVWMVLGLTGSGLMYLIVNTLGSHAK